MWKKSGNPKIEELTKSIKTRSYNLSCLPAIRLEELNSKGKPKRLCAWCAEGELFHGNQKYCTEECSESAMAWAYPQKENALKILLFRQEWKCISCQYDYSSLLDFIIKRQVDYYPGDTIMSSIFSSKNYEKLPFYYFKRLKNKAPKDRKPEIDHIIPISKGGQSLGIGNHQAICYTCHKSKTKIDNSGKRNKNE